MKRRDFILGATAAAASSEIAFAVGTKNNLADRFSKLKSNFNLAQIITSRYTSITPEHAFLENEAIKYGSMDPCMIIMQHNDHLELPNFYTFRKIMHYTTLFTSNERKISLSYNEFRQILDGDITDWSQVGSHPGKIKIAIRGHQVERLRNTYLRRYAASISPTLNWQKLIPKVMVLDEYESLASFVKNDSDVMAIGLRAVDVTGLQLVEIEGLNAITFNPKYLLSMETWLSVRLTEQGLRTFEIFLKSGEIERMKDQKIVDFAI